MQKGLKTGPTSATRKEQCYSEPQSSAERIAKKISSRMIHIRVWPVEEAAMRAAAESCGLSLAAYMRLTALYFAGAPTASESDALGVSDAIRQLDGAANNLNQLARAANKARGIVMTNGDRQVMAELVDRIEEAQARFLAYRVTAAKRPGQLFAPNCSEDG